MAEIGFLLYSTAACHLCEQAEALLGSLRLPEPIALDVMDISADDALLQRYGTRIPVLHRVADGRELQWPFTEAQVIKLLTDQP